MKQKLSEKIKTKNKSLLNECIKNYPLLLMILPGFIALFLFAYKPMYGILIAFKDYKLKAGVFGSEWVGFEHFEKMFRNKEFVNVLFNTIKISFLRILIGFPAPVILSLLLNEMRCKRYKKTIQTLTYLPHFFSWVILGGIIKMLFATVGPINSALQALGMKETIPFFADGNTFMWLVLWTAVWQGLGSGAIVYLAALSGVDPTLYEAAIIDGASRWKQVIHITLPSILGTIVTVFILSLGGVLNAGFDQIYNLYNPVVYETTDILDTYSLRLLQNGRYEIGTALGLFKSVVGVIFVFASNWVIKRLSDDEYGIL